MKNLIGLAYFNGSKAKTEKSICQLMASGWALSTGKLPRGGLLRNSLDRITDRPDMTSAVDHGRKTTKPKLLFFSHSSSRLYLAARFMFCSLISLY